ncbi:MAG: 3-oxoacyl-[acyl-carrier-protein] synthase III C-terminal domain-containing protein [Burkholderiales bacterium]
MIEVMAERLGLGPRDLAATEAVLSEHGNMSSVTILFVLDEVLRTRSPAPGSLGVLGAFGPGFAAELALVEFL